MKKKREEKAELNISVMKTNPKDNAISYELETLQDILDAVNTDNIDKFLHEFGIILRSAVLAKHLSKSKLKFTNITWIDD